MNFLQKRKRSTVDYPDPHWLASHREVDGLGATEALCVEAHETDLVCDKKALALALEAPEFDAKSTISDHSSGTRGSGLIQWSGDIGENGVWVDRFDARLLLSELPTPCSAQTSASPQPGSPQSPPGWSDLPSDTEDAFFLSPSEIADIRYAKRRRMLDDARTERLAALRAAGNNSTGADDADPWGDSDEEPDEAQKMLMVRTATHLQTSPDRTRLAARILANHGADKRFAFMRGRWRKAWVRAQAKAAAAAVEEEEKKKTAKGLELMGLGAYGDSDQDESEADEALEIQEKENEEKAAKMEARRARAREWIAKRRAEKKDADAGDDQ